MAQSERSMMMNLSKSLKVLNPAEVKERIHIIGCGSVGSTIAELLARYGFTKFNLYDFDTVEAKNIVNQMFTEGHIGMNKCDALADILYNINPESKKNVRLFKEGWNGQNLSGYVFLAVDNIEVRQKIVDQNKFNMNIKAMFDVRTALYDAQLYAADWADNDQRKAFRDSMNFSHEEATAEVPVSACGTVLGVAPTVRMASTMTVINFVNLIKKKVLKKMILVNPFDLDREDMIFAV